MAEQLCELKKKGGSSGGAVELNQMIKFSATAAGQAIDGIIELDIAMLKACGCSKFGIQGSVWEQRLILSYAVDSGTYTSITSGTMYTIPNGTKLKIRISVYYQSASYLEFSNFVLLLS